MEHRSVVSFEDRDPQNLWKGLDSYDLFYRGDDGLFYKFDDGGVNQHDEAFQFYETKGGYPYEMTGDVIENPVYFRNSEYYDDRPPPRPSKLSVGELGHAGITSPGASMHCNPEDLLHWIAQVREVTEVWLPILVSAAEGLPARSNWRSGNFTQGYQVDDLLSSMRGMYVQNAEVVSRLYEDIFSKVVEIAKMYENADVDSEQLAVELRVLLGQMDGDA